MAKLSGGVSSRARESAGLTLLGVLVASILFATILVATFSLVARTMREVGRSRENFTAVNLAREGLELIQFIRDSNMQLCPPGNANPECPASSAWTGNVLGGDALCATDGENQLIVDRYDNIPGGTRVQQLTNPGGDQLYLAGARYQHDSTAAPTLYSRRITIDCANRAAPNDERIVVKSSVTWQTRGEEHQVELRNHMYNWYQ